MSTNQQIRAFQRRHGIEKRYNLTPFFIIALAIIVPFAGHEYVSAQNELHIAQAEYSTVSQEGREVSIQ